MYRVRHATNTNCSIMFEFKMNPDYVSIVRVYQVTHWHCPREEYL